MNADRLLAFAAALGCKALEVRDCLRSLSGNGRPASLDEHFATVPRDPAPVLPAALWDAAVADPSEFLPLFDLDAGTPIGDALAATFARIDAACEDFAREVEANADAELRELIEGEAS